MGVKLPNAPLQEVLFEAFWDLHTGPKGELYDPYFELSLGQFAQQATAQLPHHEFLEGRLDSLLGPRVWHRFRSGADAWPLVQIGPGLLTVNDTELNYVWVDNFFPLIQHALEWMASSYPSALTFSRTTLRYIDFLKFLSPEMNMSEFVKNYLNLQIGHGLDSLGFPDSFFQRQAFRVGNETTLAISLSDGRSNLHGHGAIMEIALIRESPIESNAIPEWLEWAHDIASRTFKESIKPALHEYFK